MRVIGLASSEAEYHTAATGVGGAMHYLFQELATRVDLVSLYQPDPSPLRKGLSRLATFTDNPDVWRRSYKRHRPLFLAKSRLCRREIDRRRGEIDVIFQWEFFFSPTDRYPSTVPYCVYNDWTTALSVREYPEWAPPRIRQGIDRAQGDLIRNAAYAFAFTDKVRHSLIDDYGVSANKVVTTGAGINLDVIPTKVHKKYDAPVLLLAGNDYTRKGVDVLARALPLIHARFPECRAIVVGDPGDYRAARVPGLDIRGPIGNKGEMSALYRQASLFVLPTRAEAFGHVLAEAMAFQLPCIGSNTGGVPEVIGDGDTGYLVPVDDHKALAAHVIDLFERPRLMARMGERGYRKAIDKFTWPKVVDRMMPYLRDATGIDRAGRQRLPRGTRGIDGERR